MITVYYIRNIHMITIYLIRTWLLASPSLLLLNGWKNVQRDALTAATTRLYITYLTLVLSFSTKGVTPGGTTLYFNTLFLLSALSTLPWTLLLKYMLTYLDTYLPPTQHSPHTYSQHLNALICSCSSLTENIHNWTDNSLWIEPRQCAHKKTWPLCFPHLRLTFFLLLHSFLFSRGWFSGFSIKF